MTQQRTFTALGIKNRDTCSYCHELAQITIRISVEGKEALVCQQCADRGYNYLDSQFEQAAQHSVPARADTDHSVSQYR